MARDAISGYITSLRKHKDPIPTETLIWLWKNASF
jgi:hypothetical protein